MRPAAPLALALTSLAMLTLVQSSSVVVGWGYDAARNGAWGCTPTAPCWVVLRVTRHVRLRRFPYPPRAARIAWDYGDGTLLPATGVLSLVGRDELAGWEEWRGEQVHA